MQFSCESCKATLHIGDEKVKGKRLVVRCKRCGSRIQISDPALGVAAVMLAQQAAPRPAAPAPSHNGAADAPAAPPPAASAATPLGTRPVSRPLAAAVPADDRDTDTESTRAMDSDVLEQALRASKAPDAIAPAPAPSAAPAPLAAPAPAAPEAGIWFAMIGGKQTGPLAVAEIARRVGEGAIGPRTYVWKEGMGAWQRSKDVPEIAALIGVAPEQAPAPQQHQGSAPTAHASPRISARTPFPSGNPFAASAAEPFPLDPPVPAEAPAPAHHEAPAARHNEPEPEPVAPAPAAAEAPAAAAIDPSAETTQAEPAKEAPQAALDLARWASSELTQPGAPEPLKDEKPPVPDPFAQVPIAPGFAEPDKKETTDSILARSGVRRNRSLSVVLAVCGTLAVLATLLYLLTGGGKAETPAPAQPSGRLQPPQEEPQRPSLGGTGDNSVSGLARTQPAQPPRGPGPAQPGAKKQDAARPVAQGQLSADQEAAMKGLDDNTQLGIGSHGPRAGEADAPAPEKVDAPLTAQDVKRKLDENKAALQSCIDEALRRDPGLRVGKIHISTTIAPSGSVTATRIDKRNVDESQLGACLKRATKRIVFPAFGGDPFEVDIPIVVTAGD